MPLTRIDLLRGKSVDYRATLCDVIYTTLSEVVDVPEDDRFEIITEHDPENVTISPNFFGIERSSDAVMIQITFNEGRTMDQKRAFYTALVSALHKHLGMRPEDVMVNLLEAKKENWSFGDGKAQYIEAS